MGTIHQIQGSDKSKVGPPEGVGTIDPGEPQVTVYASQYAPETGYDAPWSELERRIAEPLVVAGLTSADDASRKKAKAAIEYISLHRRYPDAWMSRTDADVQWVYGCWLDPDTATRETVLGEMESLGCRVTVYPSPSHWARLPHGEWRVRGVVRYSRPVSPAEHRAIYRWIRQRCPSTDPTMQVPGVGCYAPAVDPAHAHEWWVMQIDGAEVLDVDAVLAEIGPIDDEPEPVQVVDLSRYGDDERVARARALLRAEPSAEAHPQMYRTCHIPGDCGITDVAVATALVREYVLRTDPRHSTGVPFAATEIAEMVASTYRYRRRPIGCALPRRQDTAAEPEPDADGITWSTVRLGQRIEAQPGEVVIDTRPVGACKSTDMIATVADIEVLRGILIVAPTQVLTEHLGERIRDRVGRMTACDDASEIIEHRSTTTTSAATISGEAGDAPCETASATVAWLRATAAPPTASTSTMPMRVGTHRELDGVPRSMWPATIVSTLVSVPKCYQGDQLEHISKMRRS